MPQWLFPASQPPYIRSGQPHSVSRPCLTRVARAHPGRTGCREHWQTLQSTNSPLAAQVGRPFWRCAALACRTTPLVGVFPGVPICPFKSRFVVAELFEQLFPFPLGCFLLPLPHCCQQSSTKGSAVHIIPIFWNGRLDICLDDGGEPV